MSNTPTPIFRKNTQKRNALIVVLFTILVIALSYSFNNIGKTIEANMHSIERQEQIMQNAERSMNNYIDALTNGDK